MGLANFDMSATAGSPTKDRVANAFRQSMVGTTAPIPTRPPTESPTKGEPAGRHWTEGWVALEALEAKVYKHGTKVLPGIQLQVDQYVPLLQKAVRSSTITPDQYRRMMNLFRFGADLFIDQEYLTTHLPSRVFRRNYPTALENCSAVHDAICSRVSAGKTFKIGRFTPSDFKRLPVSQAIVFPLGAVPKPGGVEYRPFGDHTKSRLNEAARPWKHSLDALNELKRKLYRGRFVRMSDIDGAFTLLPLVPWLWKYMLFVWFDVDVPLGEQENTTILYCHLFADFGTTGCPLEWFEFFTVTLELARMEGVLRSDLVLYVDDLSHLGDEQAALDDEGEELDGFLARLGTGTKQKKTRSASQLQLSLGLWWNTVTFTLWLTEEKLADYREFLLDMASRRVVTLRDMQRVAGREQRCALTLTPGSKVLLANNFILMSGLRLPHHHRRTTKAWRDDRAAMVRCLEENMGQGYYRYDDFTDGGDVYTDASKPGRGRAGGGYVQDTGFYHWWVFGSAASRRPIDWLEGKTVVHCVEDCGPQWAGKMVRFHIDNSSFQASAAKSWSHAERLNELLRELLYLTVKYNCILIYHWISTHENSLADPLSRQDEPLFLERATAATSPLCGPPRRHPDAGTRR